MFKKFGKNIIFFLILLILTMYVLFKGQNVEDLIAVLGSVHIRYIFLGLLVMFLYILCEAINTKLLLKEFGYKKNIFTMIKYALIGFFYSSITPSASGGQPVEIYHMSKDGIDVAESTIALLVMACSYHIATLIIAVIGAVYNYSYLIGHMRYLWILLLIGLAMKLFILALLISVIFWPQASTKLVNVVKKVTKKLKLKKADAINDKVEAEVANFRKSSDYLKKHKLVFLRMLIITLIQMMAFYSTTYITALAFGITGLSYINVTLLQAVLFSGISSIPLPGSMGVNEVGFKVLFVPIFGKNLVASATLLSRFVSFYFYVILSGIVSVWTYIKQHKNG